jgi:hypothetical protein
MTPVQSRTHCTFVMWNLRWIAPKATPSCVGIRDLTGVLAGARIDCWKMQTNLFSLNARCRQEE